MFTTSAQVFIHLVSCYSHKRTSGQMVQGIAYSLSLPLVCRMLESYCRLSLNILTIVIYIMAFLWIAASAFETSGLVDKKQHKFNNRVKAETFQSVHCIFDLHKQFPFPGKHIYIASSSRISPLLHSSAPPRPLGTGSAVVLGWSIIKATAAMATMPVIYIKY